MFNLWKAFYEHPSQSIHFTKEMYCGLRWDIPFSWLQDVTESYKVFMGACEFCAGLAAATCPGSTIPVVAGLDDNPFKELYARNNITSGCYAMGDDEQPTEWVSDIIHVPVPRCEHIGMYIRNALPGGLQNCATNLYSCIKTTDTEYCDQNSRSSFAPKSQGTNPIARASSKGKLAAPIGEDVEGIPFIGDKSTRSHTDVPEDPYRDIESTRTYMQMYATQDMETAPKKGPVRFTLEFKDMEAGVTSEVVQTDIEFFAIDEEIRKSDIEIDNNSFSQGTKPIVLSHS